MAMVTHGDQELWCVDGCTRRLYARACTFLEHRPALRVVQGWPAAPQRAAFAAERGKGRGYGHHLSTEVAGCKGDYAQGCFSRVFTVLSHLPHVVSA